MQIGVYYVQTLGMAQRMNAKGIDMLDLFGNDTPVPTEAPTFDPLAGEEPGEWRLLYDDDGRWQFAKIPSGYAEDLSDGGYHDLDLVMYEVIFMPAQLGSRESARYASETPYYVSGASYDVRSYEVGPEWLAKIHHVLRSCGMDVEHTAPLPADLQAYFDFYRNWRTWHGTAHPEEPSDLVAWEQSARDWFNMPYIWRADALWSYFGGDPEGEYETLRDALAWGAYVPTSLVDQSELDDVPLYGEQVKCCKRCDHPLVHPAHIASHRAAHAEHLQYDRAYILDRWRHRHD